ncbi:hypothetical protein [Thiohalomonas denitrificans]|uniref:MORN repeat variant n=1 Tax=Thiohalomonas denitrificans TaxID=415747 RepID=A0A1G5PSU2_9GAMM|nr:hypothetical protein [Thiohalomonas denitrificans]SCZ52129.1 hypothetical protein SAMN03097708_00676 [Thiohalomonas denitrificans]
MRAILFWLVLLGCSSTVHGADYLRDKSEVRSLLEGQILQGTYLRTGSAYTLEFAEDGTLRNSSGAEGRWWVNDQGQYCREWLSGRLKGNKACLDLMAEDDGGIAIYSRGKRVAEGLLTGSR